MKKLSIVLIIICCTITSAFAQKTLGNGKPITGMNNNNPGANNFEREEGLYYTVNGMNMYYESYGDGEPVLIIHDNGGSVESLNNQLNFFSKKFRVIVADSRGQGKSLNNRDSINYELMADDYYLLLEGLDIDSVNIIGWGDGGIIGLLLAINYPEKVKKLTIAGTALRTDTMAVRPAAIALWNDAITALKDSLAAGKKEYKDELLIAKLRAHHADIETELLLNINSPVLIISGDKDYVKLEHTVEIFNTIPNAHLGILPGTTHNVLKESAMQCNNMMLRFFNQEFVRPDGIHQMEKKQKVDD